MELDSTLKPTKLWKKRRKVSEFIVDKTLIKVGRELVWLWIAIEPPIEKVILLLTCIFLLKGVYTCC
jgi:transposase-like protein